MEKKLKRSGVKYRAEGKYYTWKNLNSHKHKIKKMPYQHQIIPLTGVDTIRKTLDEMSLKGWELVAVVEDRHYFKKYNTPVGKTGPSETLL